MGDNEEAEARADRLADIFWNILLTAVAVAMVVMIASML